MMYYCNLSYVRQTMSLYSGLYGVEDFLAQSGADPGW